MLRIFAGFVSGLCSFGMGLMMQVGPQDAATNLCRWFPRPAACHDWLPGWFDQWAWVLPLLLALLACVLLFWVPLRALGRLAFRFYSLKKTRDSLSGAIKKPPFFFAPYIHPESRSVRTESGQETALYENTYYLGVGNDEPNGKNLRRVQVRLYGYDLATQTTLLNSDTSIETDLRHGEVQYFKIGRVISRETRNIPRGSVTIEDKRVEMYSHNLDLGHTSFEVWSSERKKEFGLGGKKEPNGEPFKWPMGVLVTADDTKSVNLALQIDFSNERELVSIVDGVSNA